MKLIRKIHQAKNSLQKMIAIFPAPDHMQEQIEFGGSRANKLSVIKFPRMASVQRIPVIYYEFYLKTVAFKHQ